MVRIVGTVFILSSLFVSKDLFAQQTQRFEGYLSFQWVEQGTYYILKDGLGQGFTAYVDSLLALPGGTLNKQEDRIALQAKLFRDSDWQDLAHFTMQVDSSLFVVHCDSIQYKQIKGFNRADLLENGERVKIQLEGLYFTRNIPQLPNIIICKQDLSVTVEQGVTGWKN